MLPTFEKLRRDTARRVTTATLLALTAGMLLAACGSDDGDDEGAQPARADAAAVATTYADLVLASYDASVDRTVAMQQRIERFLRSPSASTLEAARKAWVDARDDYVPTEPFRFYGGPIEETEGQINAWPMDEAYVDYVAGNRRAGIVNDAKRHPKITPAVLVEANEQGGETNISTGWHAIEFLLWGQDRSKDGPGARPAGDYTSAPNAKRRGQYLRLATEQLHADLVAVRDQWAKDGGEFRTAFLADPQRAVTRILRGIGALTATELSGERMAVAYESGDQEDEHSCFSDNTNADVVNDIKGIRNVYLAEFPGISGPSLDSLVADRDPELSKQLRARIDGNLAKAEAFPATFETMIAAPEGSPERKALGDAIEGLEEQGDMLEDVAEELDIKVGFEV